MKAYNTPQNELHIESNAGESLVVVKEDKTIVNNLESNSIPGFPEFDSTDEGKTFVVNNEGKLEMGESGTKVSANPELVGTESNLTGLEVGGTKYKIPEGGGGVVVISLASQWVSPNYHYKNTDVTFQNVQDYITDGKTVILTVPNGSYYFIYRSSPTTPNNMLFTSFSISSSGAYGNYLTPVSGAANTDTLDFVGVSSIPIVGNTIELTPDGSNLNLPDTYYMLTITEMTKFISKSGNDTTCYYIASLDNTYGSQVCKIVNLLTGTKYQAGYSDNKFTPIA